MPPDSQSLKRSAPLLEQQIHGTRRRVVIHEWLTNTFHFPIANIILESLLEGPLEYLGEVDLYAILSASLVQAWLLGSWQFEGRPKPLIGNLIGPAIYTLIELSAEGLSFFDNPYHWAYWGFSLLIGCIQQWRLAVTRETALILLENVVRTSILIVTYWMLESLQAREAITPAVFFSDGSHEFLVIVVLFLGLLIGIANATSQAYLAQLRRTAHQLRGFSEWLLGKEILSRAVANPQELALKRRERALLFLDIRGFTAWSERHSPEAVVSLLNNGFARAEAAWRDSGYIKVKFTGDEIMLVFAAPAEALDTAIRLHHAMEAFLTPYGLSSGIGLHAGLLVEGLLGSAEIKGYDVIGDTVNTAKRICDQAAGGEILISEALRAQLPQRSTGTPRKLNMKGKAEPMRVYPVSVRPRD